MAWKAASARQVFYSGTFEGEYAVKEVWRQGWKMSYRGITGVYFMEKRAEMMGVIYIISESFADSIRFRKKGVGDTGLPRNYEEML